MTLALEDRTKKVLRSCWLSVPYKAWQSHMWHSEPWETAQEKYMGCVGNDKLQVSEAIVTIIKIKQI